MVSVSPGMLMCGPTPYTPSLKHLQADKLLLVLEVGHQWSGIRTESRRELLRGRS